MTTRWGLACAGNACHDFAVALSTLSISEHVVVAVAARNLDRAQQFADNLDIPTVHGSYYELAFDSNVDAVYVGSINTEHRNICRMMIEAGKPVLCEKPLAMNQREVRELVGLAREKGLFLMEAVWSRFFPAYEELQHQLEFGALGDVTHIIVHMGEPIAEVDRIKLKDLGGGAVLDMGVYVLQFALLLLGAQRPKRLAAVGHLNEHGVDSEAAVVLSFQDGTTAVLSISTHVHLPNEAIVVGTRGSAKLANPFWCPTELIVNDRVLEFPLPTASQAFKRLGNCAGMRYQAMEVRRCLQEGLLESPKMSHEESLLLAELEDTIREQIGVVYDQDKE